MALDERFLDLTVARPGLDATDFGSKWDVWADHWVGVSPAGPGAGRNSGEWLSADR
jgi:hypothetical protein